MRRFTSGNPFGDDEGDDTPSWGAPVEAPASTIIQDAVKKEVTIKLVGQASISIEALDGLTFVPKDILLRLKRILEVNWPSFRLMGRDLT
jgi:hypothetical protein